MKNIFMEIFTIQNTIIFASTTLASYSGAFFGIKKYEKEKSFDYRIKWHQELIDTTKKLLNRSNSLKYFIQKNNTDATNIEVIQELGHLSFKFQELAEQSSIYAEKNTHNHIKEVVLYLNSLEKSFVEHIDDKDLENELHPFNLSIIGLNVILSLATRDMRKMLGLKKLDEHKWLNKL